MYEYKRAALRMTVCVVPSNDISHCTPPRVPINAHGSELGMNIRSSRRLDDIIASHHEGVTVHYSSLLVL